MANADAALLAGLRQLTELLAQRLDPASQAATASEQPAGAPSAAAVAEAAPTAVAPAAPAPAEWGGKRPTQSCVYFRTTAPRSWLTALPNTENLEERNGLITAAALKCGLVHPDEPTYHGLFCLGAAMQQERMSHRKAYDMYAQFKASFKKRVKKWGGVRVFTVSADAFGMTGPVYAADLKGLTEDAEQRFLHTVDATPMRSSDRRLRAGGDASDAQAMANPPMMQMLMQCATGVMQHIMQEGPIYMTNPGVKRRKTLTESALLGQEQPALDARGGGQQLALDNDPKPGSQAQGLETEASGGGQRGAPSGGGQQPCLEAVAGDGGQIT